MASTTALRRDLAPIVRVRVTQGTGGNMEQVTRGCIAHVTQGREESFDECRTDTRRRLKLKIL